MEEKKKKAERKHCKKEKKKGNQLKSTRNAAVSFLKVQKLLER